MADILAPVVLDLHVNASDTELLRNLRYAKSLNLPYVDLAPAKERALAVVGSGPSLARTWAGIPKDADIMALNGAYKFLTQHGRTAKYFAMLDARECNKNFLTDPEVTTYHLLASQCHPACFDALKDYHRAVFHLNTPTTCLVFDEGESRIGCVYTIGLTALILGAALGYRKFILYGFDSSYELGKRNVLPQEQNVRHETLEVEIQGRQYLTSHAMAGQVMEFLPTVAAIRRHFPDADFQIIGDGLFYDFVTTNNRAPTRESELSKYLQAYEDPTYGMSLERYHGIDALLGAEFKDKESYLDVATGRGETMKLAIENGFKHVRGTETVPKLLNENVTYGVLPNLPEEDKSYSVVSLIEVIEHLLPADLEPALQELTRIARDTIIISAATVPHFMGGVDLHPSARSTEEWEYLFRSVWGTRVKRVGNLGSSPVWRVDL